MTRRQLTTLWGCVFVSALLTAGCLNSESEYLRLVEEKESLSLELKTAKAENAILRRAEANILKEREALQTLLSRAVLAPSAGSPTAPPAAEAPSRPPDDKVYRAQPGDTLSSIAGRHNATVEQILALNPTLANRSNNMVWIDDLILLP
ncbi:MAG: LysM peptidoglycan-binding domain-containing protein [Candidatus Adiutrix sp.]|nr:LysM peptidoglycan-binding domain-containing protein [Candidatus Adiutrix sp.]